MAEDRMTKQQRLILTSLNGADWVFGRQIIRGTGLKSGTVYPALARLARKGLIESEREVGHPQILERPLRIHYRLTTRGSTFVNGDPYSVEAPGMDIPTMGGGRR